MAFWRWLKLRVRMCLRVRGVRMRLRWRRSMISRLLMTSRPANAFKPGLYEYKREMNGERARLHLRVASDLSAVVLLNASRVLHLNPTAARMAWLALEGVGTRDATRMLQRTFDAPASTVQADYLDVKDRITRFARSDGACPIHDLEFDLLPLLRTTRGSISDGSGGHLPLQ